MEESIFNKIEKCLALSKSSNPHEAAVALKQAQALKQSVILMRWLELNQHLMRFYMMLLIAANTILYLIK